MLIKITGAFYLSDRN